MGGAAASPGGRGSHPPLMSRSDRSFRVDAQQLQRRFRSLQRAVHPDRFGQRPPVSAGPGGGAGPGGARGARWPPLELAFSLRLRAGAAASSPRCSPARGVRGFACVCVSLLRRGSAMDLRRRWTMRAAPVRQALAECSDTVARSTEPPQSHTQTVWGC